MVHKILILEGERLTMNGQNTNLVHQDLLIIYFLMEKMIL